MDVYVSVVLFKRMCMLVLYKWMCMLVLCKWMCMLVLCYLNGCVC